MFVGIVFKTSTTLVETWQEGRRSICQSIYLSRGIALSGNLLRRRGGSGRLRVLVLMDPKEGERELAGD